MISGKVENVQRVSRSLIGIRAPCLFRRVFLGECRDRRLAVADRRQPDFTQVFVRIG